MLRRLPHSRLQGAQGAPSPPALAPCIAPGAVCAPTPAPQWVPCSGTAVPAGHTAILSPSAPTCALHTRLSPANARLARTALPCTRKLAPCVQTASTPCTSAHTFRTPPASCIRSRLAQALTPCTLTPCTHLHMHSCPVHALRPCTSCTLHPCSPTHALPVCSPSP